MAIAYTIKLKTWREAFFIILLERKKICNLFQFSKKKSVYPSGATIPVVVEVGEH